MARDHAVERAGRVYRLIADAARRSDPCPSNRVLRELVGLSSRQLGDSLNFLICNGMIEIERPHRNKRIVLICATGDRTA